MAPDPVRYLANHSTGTMGYSIAHAAAVADYRPAVVAGEKIKNSGTGADLSLTLECTPDISGWLVEHRWAGQYSCGFSIETQNVL